jgi:hypothetical protein
MRLGFFFGVLLDFIFMMVYTYAIKLTRGQKMARIIKARKINFEVECGVCFAQANHLPVLHTDPLNMCEEHRADWV